MAHVWWNDGKLAWKNGKLVWCDNCPCGIVCDECCDCEPSSLTVVISGTGTNADGTWAVAAVGFPTLCQWEYADETEDIHILCTKSGENMAVLAENFAEDTTWFDGNLDRDHKGACKRLAWKDDSAGGDPPAYDDYRILNGIGSGNATVEGSCTPTCATGCDETFDPPVDEVPCTGCCPSCIPDQFSVVLSGVTSCQGQCCTDGFTSIKITALSISSSFTMDRTGDSQCTWANTNIGTFSWAIYFNSNCSGLPLLSGSGIIGASMIEGAALEIRGNSPNFPYFLGDNMPSCSDAYETDNNQSVCCLGTGNTMNLGSGGTATISPC